LGTDAPKIDQANQRSESLNGKMRFSNLDEEADQQRAESCKQDMLAVRKYQSLRY